ncbi:hypothetical protein LY76DRAFT_437504 [Colletotrichum caudatum]|nr:hypothetical protein LY76DRAFT_437504 [Colletotrichum caudatum]
MNLGPVYPISTANNVSSLVRGSAAAVSFHVQRTRNRTSASRLVAGASAPGGSGQTGRLWRIRPRSFLTLADVRLSSDCFWAQLRSDSDPDMTAGRPTYTQVGESTTRETKKLEASSRLDGGHIFFSRAKMNDRASCGNNKQTLQSIVGGAKM